MTKHILIPDGNSTWALPVVRCLAYRADYKIFVLSSKKRTATKFSKNTYYYKYYEKTDEAAWINNINQEIELHHIDIILPIAEKEILFLLKNRDAISKRAKIIPLASLDTIQTAIDKYQLGKFCVHHQLPYPKSILFKNKEEFSNNHVSINYPVLLKPLHEKGGDGIVRFDKPSKLKRFVNKHSDSHGFFIQEYIEGYDIDCSVLCVEGKILTHTIQKGFLSGHNPYAPSLGIEFLENDAIYKLVSQLMSALNWSGIAHIDLRYDKNKEAYKIIEINARFWGSVEASRVANVNFPVLVCDLTLGKPIEPEGYHHLKYMRFKGVLKYVRKHPSYIFHLTSILNNTEIRSVLKDPLPTLYKFREWFGRQLS